MSEPNESERRGSAASQGASAPPHRESALICPVSGCGEPLDWRERVCACPRGHSFDIAREGYVNLLGPKDKKSTAPGDGPAAVAARGRLLDKGFGTHVLEALEEEVAKADTPDGARIVDVGCGDGFFLGALVERFSLDAYGVDLSSAALKAASRRSQKIRWIAANADRRLPFATGAFDVALSLTARRNAEELRRIVRPQGRLIVTLPAPDDLLQLRAAVLGAAVERDRVPSAVEALAGRFSLIRQRRVSRHLELHGEELRDLLASTYRGARRAEADRARELEAMTVTASADLLVFERRD